MRGLTFSAFNDTPTTIILARRVFIVLYTFIIIPRKALRGLLARRRTHGYHAKWRVRQ
jgi:hypothetical protein